MRVEPTKPRWRAEEGPGSLRFVIPAKRNWFIVLFLSFWLCGWAFGEFMVPTHFFDKSRGAGVDLFMVAWLGAWTLGGVFAIYVWLWNLMGREIVVVTGPALEIRRAVNNIGHTREFDVAHIRGLRVANQSWNPWDLSSGLRFWGVGGGAIAFDYGAKTYRFGGGLDEAEAKQILARITQVIPSAVEPAHAL